MTEQTEEEIEQQRREKAQEKVKLEILDAEIKAEMIARAKQTPTI